MNTSGDAAESIVKMSLEGMDVALRLTGTGAKNIAAILAAILKDQKQTKGKTRLSNMLKSGKELKVFTVKEEDLKKFISEAKRYGVLFCALKGKGKNIDGMVDIMVRAEDASKINRIVDRFELSTVNTASIKNEILKTKEEKNSNPNVAKTEKSPLSEHTLEFKKGLDKGSKTKPSVKEEIKKIKKEQKASLVLDKSNKTKTKTKVKGR